MLFIKVLHNYIKPNVSQCEHTCTLIHIDITYWPFLKKSSPQFPHWNSYPEPQKVDFRAHWKL